MTQLTHWWLMHVLKHYSPTYIRFKATMGSVNIMNL